MRGLYLLGSLAVALILVAVLLALLGFQPAHAPAPFTPIQLPTL